MATRIGLREKVHVQTIGRLPSVVDEVWYGDEKLLGGSVHLPGAPFGRRCLWNALGVCDIGLPAANINMDDPIGYVLRWHLDNGP